MNTQTYHIQVTGEDIIHGKRTECTACPIALAIARVYPRQPGEYVSVGNSTVTIRKKDEGIKAFGLLPLEARRFICNFDSFDMITRIKAVPFEFDITIEHH